MQIELRSALVGGAAVTAVALALGAGEPAAVQPACGERRFELLVSENRAFVIDGDTGQVWAGMHGTVDQPVFHGPKVQP